MMQDRHGNYISLNIRGLVYAMCKFVTTAHVERSFQRSGRLIRRSPEQRPNTPQGMFTIWSNSIDWTDEHDPLDGLKALSCIAQRARSVEMEKYDGTRVQGYSGPTPA